MYIFRENWEINLIILHTVPCFNPQLFTISVKSKVLLQCRFEITRPTFGRSVPWFLFVWLGKVNTTDLSSNGSVVLDHSPWLANFSSISAAMCLLFELLCQDNKFFYLKCMSSFPTAVFSEIFQIYCYCNTI